MSEPATCHPDLPHYALGLCVACYHRHYRKARKDLGRPIVLDRREYQREYRKRRKAA